MAGCLVSTGFVVRTLFFFGVMICGAVMIGTLLMDKRDIQNKNSYCDGCVLTLRAGNGGCVQGTTPCNFVTFTGTAMIVLGFVFFCFTLMNLVRGSVATSKFILIEAGLVALSFLLLFACAITISVLFQQVCGSLSSAAKTTNCQLVMDYIADNLYERLVACEGSNWALVAMLAVIFIVDLPRAAAALRGQADPVVVSEGEGEAPNKTTGIYKNFDNEAGTSGPV